MTESDHYGALWKGANAERWSLFRMADGSVGKKPADIAGCSPEGIGVLIEVKLIKNTRPSVGPSLPHWDMYATHQKAWLRKYAEAHAIAIAAEYDVSRREMRLFPIIDPEQIESVADPPHSILFRKIDELYIEWWRLLVYYSTCRWPSTVGSSRPPPNPS